MELTVKNLTQCITTDWNKDPEGEEHHPSWAVTAEPDGAAVCVMSRCTRKAEL